VESIELFTGAGGLALGLEKSGWSHKALIERDENACATIRLNSKLNHPLSKNWNLLSNDVREINYENLILNTDMVAGGPPCQPFSLGGKHQAFNDDRDMFPEAVRAVRDIKPNYFLFENVKGLLRQSFATYFNYIILQLNHPTIIKNKNESWTDHLSRLEKLHLKGNDTDLKYNVVYRLLNAADYGIPQHRHRVFIVGFRSDLNSEWSFPNPTHSLDRLLYEQWILGTYWDEHKVPRKEIPEIPRNLKSRVERLNANYRFSPIDGERYQTIRDALKDLPDPQITESKIPNHEFRPGARAYPGHTGSILDLPSKALKAGAHGVPGGENMIANYDGTYRYLTVRESARIQTFPDDYIFTGSWTEAMRQIGNAVPVKLAEVVGNSIRNQIA
jgi:DNA (cytosine-5)-methyltransferase 1